MKLIHTADWHLGRLFYGVHLTEDQACVLDQLVELVKDERPDAVLIAGDVFDRAVPPPEAVTLLDDVLGRIVQGLGVAVIVIAGNHDSPERISFGARLLAPGGLHVAGRVQARPDRVTLRDEWGSVHVCSVPSCEPAFARDAFDTDDIHDHQAAMKALVRAARRGLPMGERSVLVGHAFVAGGEPSESERPLSVGGAGTVEASVFEGFEYVALGHLHRPQWVSGGPASTGTPASSGAADRGASSAACSQATGLGQGSLFDVHPDPSSAGDDDAPSSVLGAVRYAGSLLKYSFGEAGHRKSISVVEIDGRGGVQVREATLSPRHDVRQAAGLFKDLRAGGASASGPADDYLSVTLLDAGPVLDAMSRLRDVYPNLVHVERSEVVAVREQGRAADHRQVGEEEVFASFFEEVTGAPLSTAESEAFAQVAEVLRRKEREA